MKLIYKSLIILTLVVISSCSEDFLELTPQQSISNDDFLKTFDDFQSAILGGYDQMQNSDWYGRYMILVPDVMGEDVKQNASANRAKEWAEYSGAPVDFIPEEFWAEIYEGINIANSMINAEFEPPTSLTEEFNQILGEAYALRALAYFDLVRLFAQHYTFTSDASHLGVPIVLEFDVESKPARNTVAEVYSQIIDDFNQAISLMSIDPANAGYFSSEAAQALLSRVYLYMEDFGQAESLATAVISTGKFSLVSAADYPMQFFNGNSPEAILEINFNLADNPGADHIGGMYKESGYGDYLPSEDLLNLIPDGDVRSTLFRIDTTSIGGIYGNLRVDKYPSEGADIATDNVPVIRLSEVYLIRAEARAKSSDDAGAQADLNLIRQRALPTAPDVTATGADLITEILNERRIELAFEGHSIFDVTRNELDVVRDDCTAPANACSISYPNDRFILAIPIEETDVNPNMIQNDSYGQ
ncbi:MAG: RagB/SusD family nutrient uptake outer membrane protein [Bacteroidota bacterium]